MKFEEIPVPRLSLRVRDKRPDGRLKAGDVRSLATSRMRGEFELLCMDGAVTIVPYSTPDANRLTDILSTGRAKIARLSDVDAAGGALLTVLMFSGEQIEIGTVEVGVDERTADSLNKRGLDEAARVMKEQSVLTHCGSSYFILAAGGATKAYLEGSDSEERHFAVIGSDIRYALAERAKGNGEMVFLASGITKMRNRREDSALRLARGELKFVDWTKAGQRAVLAKAQLDAITQGPGSYLKKWDEFGKAEGDMFLERARAVGKVAFEVIAAPRGGPIHVKCMNLTEAQRDALRSVSEIDVVNDNDIPVYLNDLTMSFGDYTRSVVEKIKAVEFLGEEGQTRDDANKCGLRTLSVIGFNGATGEMLLDAQDEPTEKWIIYSVAGEVAQMKRREEARTAILNGRAANPDLGLLIEEGGRIPASQPPPKMKAMTDFVRRKVFPKHDPTDTQKEAVKIALNTPDIALIQGPPGTGKTTVIAAILERLNEECDKRVGISGRVLLSGFQHDAVENMIGRLKLNGLPVPKFGQRSGKQRNEDLLKFEYELQKWCAERALELRIRNPQISESLEERNIRALCVQYINAPSRSLAEMLLDAVLKLPVRTLGETLSKELQQERRRLVFERDCASQNAPQIAVVRGMRITEAGFCDDGPDRAADALFQLKDDLQSSERKLLEQASQWSLKDGVPPFIKELHELKGELLKRYTPMPVFRTEKVRDSVVKLIKEVLSCVRVNGVSSRDKRTDALAELLQEMENNPSGILDAVRDYSFAFAATCQQSVNGMMREMKGVRPLGKPSHNKDRRGGDQDGAAQEIVRPEEKLEYDFVIVDEAARVSPRDLMIPMSQGKRIILVGDHRQLPQLIDEDVAKRVESEDGAESEEGDWLKKSMFEYLFTERIPKLESDGVARHITLDCQYRMHPDLGDFISRNFYERFGEKKIMSGLPADMFVHDLPGVEGRCAVWLDVPREQGDMTKQGTSWTRPAEVDAICERLKSWIEQDNQKVLASPSADIMPLSFGVISFYKAQTDEIKRGLGKKWRESYEAQVNEIKNKLGEKWSEEEIENRLRIGTVDSFQGREFDVVFLSLVRMGNKGFGFLKLSNRLNVSMSRQKRLLVAVGDAAFFDTDSARLQVPGVADFLSLCREKGCVL